MTIAKEFPVYKCDSCGEEAHGRTRRALPNGWWELYRYNESREDPLTYEEFHFDSLICVKNFIEELDNCETEVMKNETE